MSNIRSAQLEHRQAMRDLHSHLAGAGDGKLREIVALVDSLPDRGAADQLIAPLRGRLTVLRPQRRMSLNRFLFLPADPIITHAAQWRRSALAIPRSALMCLAQTIRNEIGADDAVWTAGVDGLGSDDHAHLLQHGRVIWPRVASILETLPVPPEWAGMTGLNIQDFIAIVRPLSVLLGEAVAVEHMAQMGDSLDELAPPLRASLTRAQEALARMPTPENASLGGRCLGMLLAVLLARMPAAESLLVAAGDFASRSGDPLARLAADSAIDSVLDQAEARLAMPNESINVADLARFAALIDAVEQPGPACRATRKPRVIALRRNLDAHCRHRFEANLIERLLPHVPLLDANTSDEMMSELEAAALDLRRLENVGRMLGGGPHYERALAEATRALIQLAGPDAQRIDLARLSEILLGPEAALAIFDGETPLI